ncbi:MAG: Tab2/Atab2 family RNA-binding protein [Cyanobacteriota bacterium]|nr:Tab2/Atab2 family RNA-binding protein [Cyanobacteriota bacterium]
MGTVWEIDFYSRPILDENQKKLWELLAIERPTTTTRSPESLFRYAQYCPSTTVNSIWLGEAMSKAIAEAPNPPTNIRFFRRQMNNMITKACKDLGLDVKISRRTIALEGWLRDRMEEVYPNEPNYQASSASSASVLYQPSVPQKLPDALEGQKWAFVNLSAKDLAEMPEWEIDFGEGFPLSLAGVDPDTPIPGAIVFSDRAFPVAAWMSGLELGFLKLLDRDRPQFLLETGADNSWILADLVDRATQTEARNFEKMKQDARGVHFLAIQADPNSESFAGFWLLQELSLG